MKIIGLEVLTKDAIEFRSQKLLLHFNPNFLKSLHPTPLKGITGFLNENHGIEFDFDANLGFNSTGNRILGSFSPKKRKIMIDSSINDNETKFNFILAHELGHLALHRHITFDNSGEDDHKDIEYDFDGKKKLDTDWDWMEWQANYYASCILLPTDILIAGVDMARSKIGLARRGKILLDEQKCNIQDFHNTLLIMSEYFHVSKSVIEYRLRALNLIEEKHSTRHISEIIKSSR